MIPPGFVKNPHSTEVRWCFFFYFFAYGIKKVELMEKEDLGFKTFNIDRKRTGQDYIE